MKKARTMLLSFILAIALLFAGAPTALHAETSKPVDLSAKAGSRTAAASEAKAISSDATGFPGTGTAADPYRIATVELLAMLAEKVNSGDTATAGSHFRLDADIDLSANENWTPIGKSTERPFTGVFDGNGRSIRNMRMVWPLPIAGDNATYGLFGVNSGEIRDLAVAEASIAIPERAVIGGITGATSGSVINCTFSGSIDSPYAETGGIAGKMTAGAIRDCVNAGRVIGYTAGGIVACASGGAISGSRNTGNIGGTTDGAMAGGIVGSLTAGQVAACLNSGVIKASTTGGIAGRTEYQSSVSDSANHGHVSGSGAGGIVAINQSSIDRCFNTAAVIGAATGGGIAGMNSSPIKDSYNTGIVTAATYAGGIAGYSSAEIRNSFNTGRIASQILNGGLAGFLHYGSLANCYYLDTANSPAGRLDGVGPGTATRCTADQMKLQATFAGFDFTGIWSMAATPHAPVLKAQNVALTGMAIDDFSMVTGETRAAPLAYTPETATIRETELTSSNPEIVAVLENGRLQGKGVGTVTLTARSETGSYVDTCTVTVRQGVETIQLPTDLRIATRQSATITAVAGPAGAYNKAVRFSGGSPGYSYVDPDGKITAGSHAGGLTVTATALDGSGTTASCTVTIYGIPVASVDIIQPPASIRVGSQVKLNAQVLPADATNPAVQWSSSNEAVAKIDASGNVTGMGRGKATITVRTVESGFSDSCEIDVIQPVTGVQLDRTNTGVAIGKQIQLNATVLPANANNQALTWQSSNPAVASVDEAGNVSGLQAGSTTITASSVDSGQSATCAVAVGAGVSQISISTPVQAERYKPVQLTAQVLPDNAVNRTLIWMMVSGPETGSLTLDGVFTGKAVGTATVAALATDGTAVSGRKDITVVQTPVAAFVTRFYQLFFSRDPDEGGLDYWVESLNRRTQTGADVSGYFVDSPEFQALNASDATYLTMMYRAFFNREADAGGRAYWQDKLDSGLSRRWVLAQFVNSPEFGTVCQSFGITRGQLTLTRPADQYPQITMFVARFYKLCLERMPDSDGLDYWVSSLRSGQRTGASLADDFISSEEFHSRPITLEMFIDIMYRTFFNRESDAGGKAYWTDRIMLGYSWHYVLVGFVNSPEFGDICRDYQINKGTLAQWLSDRSVSEPLDMYMTSDDSGSISLYWLALNTSGKKISSVTATLETFRSDLTPARDRVTGASRFVVKSQTPIEPDKQFVFVASRFIQASDCAAVAILDVTLQFADGSQMKFDYKWLSIYWETAGAVSASGFSQPKRSFRRLP